LVFTDIVKGNLMKKISATITAILAIGAFFVALFIWLFKKAIEIKK
jgi:predicted permease